MRSFFAKIAASGTPGRIGTPNTAAEWEQRILTIPTARRLTDRETPKTRKVDDPKPGDQVFIYVHTERGGAGLTAAASVRDVEVSDSEFCRLTLINVQLFERPWLKFEGRDSKREFTRGRSKILATGFLKEPHRFRPDRTLEMNEVDIDDLIATLSRLNDRSLMHDQSGHVVVRSSSSRTPIPNLRVESAANPLLEPTRPKSRHTTSEPDNAWDDINQAQQAWEREGVSATDKDTLIKARLGQGRFRERLVAFWEGCAVLGELPNYCLRASHIKPWRHCDDRERLDPYNGLLLSPTLDHLFDQALITFDESSNLRVHTEVDDRTRALLLTFGQRKLLRLTPQHENYLRYHRELFLSWPNREPPGY